MTLSLLQLCKDAADLIGIARPTSVFSSSDRANQRLFTMSVQEGVDLMETVDWTMLQRLHTFTTTTDTAEYTLPADYDRLIQSTEWDRSRYEPLIGPLSPQRWQAIKSGLIGSGVVGRRYRIYRSESTATRTFRLDPTPTSSDAGETLAFEYISSYWCATSGGTAQATWAADTDYTLLPDRLHMLGTVVRFKRALGLDFASEADEHANLLGRKSGQDRPAPTLSMAPSPRIRLIGPENLPETGLGS